MANAASSSQVPAMAPVPAADRVWRRFSRAQRLHDSVASMSEAVLAYRSLTDVREPLLAWLAAEAARSA